MIEVRINLLLIFHSTLRGVLQKISDVKLMKLSKYQQQSLVEYFSLQQWIYKTLQEEWLLRKRGNMNWKICQFFVNKKQNRGCWKCYLQLILQLIRQHCSINYNNVSVALDSFHTETISADRTGKKTRTTGYKNNNKGFSAAPEERAAPQIEK